VVFVLSYLLADAPTCCPVSEGAGLSTLLGPFSLRNLENILGRLRSSVVEREFLSVYLCDHYRMTFRRGK